MKDLGFIDLEMYTKIDDNSAVNLFPILAGKATTRRVAGDGRELLGPDKHPVNHEEYEHIWDTFKSKFHKIVVKSNCNFFRKKMCDNVQRRHNASFSWSFCLSSS